MVPNSYVAPHRGSERHPPDRTAHHFGMRSKVVRDARLRHRLSLLVLSAVEGDVAGRSVAISSSKFRWVLRRNGLLSIVNCG